MIPVISIVIPVYNVEKYLPQCIESIIRQTFTDFELILVDDGSTDNSLKICKEYAARDSRITVFHQENLGVSRARNYGLKLAQGEWITFVDSDDWIDNDFLRNFHIEQHQDADIIVQGLKYIDHGTGQVKRTREFGDDRIEVPDMEGKLAQYDVLSFGVTVCKCFKRELAERCSISFDESISYHEDHVFTLSYIANSHIIVLSSACGYNYRCGHNPQSLSKKKYDIEKHIQASRMMMQELGHVADRFNLSSEYYNKTATFCLSPKISAVRTLFQKKASRNETKQEMLRIMHPLEEFSKYYYPSDKKYRLVRRLANYPSGNLLYAFFLLVARFSSK